MTYLGHYQNGVIVLDNGATIPEGARVRVELVAPLTENEQRQQPSLFERYKSFIGKAEGLPADLAAQHDHYLYGTPKKQP
jgi:hypothetical protein